MDNNMKLPVIALRDLIVFPKMVTHFDCGRPKSIAAVDAAEIKESLIFLTAQKDSEIMDPTEDDLYEYGTVATVKQILKIPGGIVRVLVEGLYRARIVDIDLDSEYYEANIETFEELEEEDPKDKNLEAAKRLVEADLSEYEELDTKQIPGILESVIDNSTSSNLVDTSAGYINLSIEDNQKLLEIVDPYERLLEYHGILRKEIEMLKIEKSIDQKVKSNMNEVQREYYLKEQLKVIHEELDEDYGSSVDEYREKIENKKLPKDVKEKVLKEVSRLAKVNEASPEYTVIINYVDWILDLPWEESSSDEIDLNHARKVLNNEHYGLKNVKERILEFIAVRKLSESSKGPILCLVGPPGVGKTSIANSIANSLDKEFVRMSLGGVTDEAEIRGHRRTYVGALPGRVISLIKKAGENNPVFLLDEIDKVGSDYKGDPASGLLEVLDPEQNKTFTDHYLELPFDLSNVFFITTANTTQTIPGPLLDRMEVIQLGGYTPEEKFNIAKKYLLPKQIKENGLKDSQFKISDGALMDIINYYTREAGVRNLEREISKCTRKAALQIVEKNKKSVSVTSRNLNKFLGEKFYLFDLIDKEDQVGVVNGLAWTEVGGETLAIETNIMPGDGKLTLTGQLGDVMKESAMAAISYLASNSDKFNIDPEFRHNKDIHIHVPEGAVPKDGPSAGITMATSVLSALSNRAVRKDIAMTGEITLRGKILPIGGLKEKLLAAERMGIKTVLIPKENERDLKEIEKNVIKGLKIIPVEEMYEVEKYALIDEE
ncbi:endopeptidase La [Peptoniphilus stercorisuis]|uniref:Lon protease n=1 Tax=Peptoniphilus stercorisuis TaxID=1436965 RepID=A0ABS4KFM9_9FIRM|nr:endopeptidase La [Peptoniphilus stercorisuis]MBP2026061.1 ATP-dependent Lon protease [Peptoniphilus stercorisuis]